MAQKLLPWAYSVDLDRGPRSHRLNSPRASSPQSLTHAVLDPATGQVLFLMESAGSRTLWSYSPDGGRSRSWAGMCPAGRSGDPTLILDTEARVAWS